MTPLFRAIYRDQAKKCRFIDECGLIADMKSKQGEVLAFDITEIAPIVNGLAEDYRNSVFDSPDFDLRTRLPAKGTWLEMEVDGTRVAYYVTQGGGHEAILVRVVGSNKAAWPHRGAELHVMTINTILWLVNTPNTVKGTLVEAPRKYRKTAPNSAWITQTHTKLRICIDGVDISPGVVSSKTGQMPLHLVRGHLRHYWEQGNRVPRWIEAHFRGNPAVGTVTHEYECYSKNRNLYRSKA